MVLFQVGENKGLVSAHFAGVSVHYAQVRPDQGGEVGLIDDQQIRPGDARAALAGNFVTGRDVDDIDGDIGEFRRERRCQVVAAAPKSGPRVSYKKWNSN